MHPYSEGTYLPIFASDNKESLKFASRIAGILIFVIAQTESFQNQNVVKQEFHSFHNLLEVEGTSSYHVSYSKTKHPNLGLVQ